MFFAAHYISIPFIFQARYEGEETAQVISEIAAIEEQLNGIEKYAMYFLEEETAESAAEQLRLAEVLYKPT